MLCHVVVALGLKLDDRQTTALHGATNLVPEGGPIRGPGMRRTEEPSRSANVETGGRTEERFKGCRV
jgi:hypothetical protein